MESTSNLKTQVHKLNTAFIQNQFDFNIQTCFAKQMENLWKPLPFDICGGGLNIKGSYFNFGKKRMTYWLGVLDRKGC